MQLLNGSLAAEDGKLVGDSDVGEFWSLFGGYAQIPRDSALAGPQQVDSPVILFWWVFLWMFLLYLCQFEQT